jgi:hypothetical protein
MRSSDPSDTAAAIILGVGFALVGVGLAFVYLGTPVDWVFTTKALAFVSDPVLLVFLVLFSASVAAIPVSAMIAQRFDGSLRYRVGIPLMSGVWLATIAVVSLVIRLIAARVHDTTLSMPADLVPLGLLATPTVTIGILLLVSCLRASSYEPRA